MSSRIVAVLVLASVLVSDGSDLDIDIFPAGKRQPSKKNSVTSGAPWTISLQSPSVPITC